MKARAALVSALIGLVSLAFAPAASAHTSGDWYKDKWIFSESGSDIDWFFVDNAFSPGTAFRDAVKAGADTWNPLTGNRQANKVANVSSVNYSPVYDCPPPREKNGVFYLTLDGVPSTGFNILAATYTCHDGDDNSHMNTANIIFDAGDNWSASSPTGSNQYDVWAIATHEFGHFFGFKEHFNEPQNANRDNSVCYNDQSYADQQTMCRFTTSGSDSVFQRSLEAHDIHTFNSTY